MPPGTPRRSTRPAARKRPKAAAPLDAAERGLRRLIVAEEPTAEEAIPEVPLRGTGTEPPLPEWVEVSQSLERYFAFIDVCGFTAYTDQHGTRAALDVLSRFRSACRDVTHRRGVRVTKWLGDGAMLVGTEAGPVIAAAAELLLRFRHDAFEVHGGIAGGVVLLFEGDDYIGRPANLAARLCEAAAPGELLCAGLDDELPDWVECVGSVTVRAAGLGDVTGVSQLQPRDGVLGGGPAAHHPSVAP